MFTIFIFSIGAIGILALIFGIALGYASIKFKVEGNPLVEQIDGLLPQLQCGKCAFAGCHPYAEAIADDESEINLCPPGGEATMLALADLLGREPLPMEDGDEETIEKPKSIAFIEEDDCIGCTACIKACPVDAILGSNKLMHTVIAHECTGCELCIEACPTDCILMNPIPETLATWKFPYPVYTENATNTMEHV